ncbi:hypothetical protein Ciccas_010249, partial [Cichlidogyrus casuarinus]
MARKKLSACSVQDEDPNSINLDEITPIRPPDGGYAWVVMIASFVCMVLVDGTCFSYGLLIDDLQDSFKTNKMTMTFAGSLITGSYLIFGPLASGLSNFYNHRTLVIMGSFISSAAVGISTFLTNVYAFIFVFGVVGGKRHAPYYFSLAIDPNKKQA